MKKVLKVIGVIILFLAVLIAALFYFIAKSPSVPENYTETVKTGGEIEAKYLAIGSYEVEHLESTTVSSLEKFDVYYPKDIDKMGKNRNSRFQISGASGTSGVMGIHNDCKRRKQLVLWRRSGIVDQVFVVCRYLQHK